MPIWEWPIWDWFIMLRLFEDGFSRTIGCLFWVMPLYRKDEWLCMDSRWDKLFWWLDLLLFWWLLCWLFIFWELLLWLELEIWLPRILLPMTDPFIFIYFNSTISSSSWILTFFSSNNFIRSFFYYYFNLICLNSSSYIYYNFLLISLDYFS